MKFGSLCAGIGGIDLAMESKGMEVVWQGELDDAAAKVLGKHWPNISNYGDIKKTDWTKVQAVDLLTAGYPCQPFSLAGQRKGIEDVRHLWPAVANAIGILRPRYAFLENVPGHLSMGLGVVLSDLARMGYDARWGCFRASSLGAPHLRKRLFILATTADTDGERWDQGRLSVRSNAQKSKFGDDYQTFAHIDSDPIWEKQISEPRSGYTTLIRGDHQDVAWGKYEPAIQQWRQVTGVYPLPRDQRGNMNPDFADWFMGFPPGWTDARISKANRIKCAGNAVIPRVGAQAWGSLIRLFPALQEVS